MCPHYKYKRFYDRDGLLVSRGISGNQIMVQSRWGVVRTAATAEVRQADTILYMGNALVCHKHEFYLLQSFGNGSCVSQL